MFLDLGSMFAYALVLVAGFFMIGVVVLFAVLHWVVRARARRAARSSGVPLTATRQATPRQTVGQYVDAHGLNPRVAPTRVPPTRIPDQRPDASWPLPGVRAAFARPPRPATRRG